MTTEENNTNNQATGNNNSQLEDIEKKIKAQEDMVVGMEKALVEAINVLNSLKKEKEELEEEKKTLEEDKQKLLNENQTLKNSSTATDAKVDKVANSLNSLEAKIVQLNNRFKEFNNK